MLVPSFYSDYQPIPSPLWERAARGVFGVARAAAGARLVVEGEIPRSPAVLATNSTQKYDFLALRAELLRRGIPAVTLTKGKNYHQPAMRFLLSRLGVIPIVSRGYLLTVDFGAVWSRRPSEAEYRALRRHLDSGEPLPPGEPFERLQGMERSMVGHPFRPDRESYREVMLRAYAASLGETVRLARQAADAGHHVQMYPEGTVSKRLGTGRIGLVQLAQALRLPIVPVGMSGCPETFCGATPALRRGTITIRFGQPFPPEIAGLPAGFRPFHPEDEEAYRTPLLETTGRVMTAIEGLLDPDYRSLPGFESAGTRGTRRFL
jgi:1-acyl-sn-glycerol-3-phosphate acyltransferase